MSPAPEHENGATPRSLWWSEGLRFSCIECGRCCRGEPGAIFFTMEEGRRVREFLKLEEPEFTRRFVTSRWEKPSFKERHNGDCIFYRTEDARCSIYPVRPAQCSLFPFWPSLLSSRVLWSLHALRCPGMNAGRFFEAEEIQELLSQCPFDDL
ncbi:MAG: YkgJ family cysteine cluster protein [Fretibacterium sp.]|nr:YkgJ family cysteine cluster protein [Fretibacterium sp.]